MFNADGWFLQTSLNTMAILQHQYPERLGLALCYHPPTLFSFTWKARGSHPCGAARLPLRLQESLPGTCQLTFKLSMTSLRPSVRL